MKFKVKGIIVSAVLFGIFIAISAGLFFTAINPSEVYADIINNGGIIFAESSANAHNENLMHSTEGIDKIKVNLSVNGIRFEDDNTVFSVTQSSDENVYLLVDGIYYTTSNKDMRVKLEKEHSTLVAELSAHHKGISLIPFSFINFFSGTVEIKIPAAYTGRVEINISEGRLVIDLPNTLKAFEVNMSAGTIETKDIVATDSVKIGLSAGTVRCGKITTKDLTVKISAGTVNLPEVAANGEIDINISAGTLAITLSDKPSEVEIRLSAGSINFYHKADTNFKIDYSVSAGNVYIYGNRFKNKGESNPTGSGILLKLRVSAGSCVISKFN